MTQLEKEIQLMVMRAIPLPECPIKRKHAIASRAWLFDKIKALVEREKVNTNDKT